MHIRCEKCNTLYDLDESLLPATGAPVQCSKCQFVFKAYPGARGEPSPAAQPAANEPAARDEPAAAESQEGIAQPAGGEPATSAEPSPGAAPPAGRRTAAAATPPETGAKAQPQGTRRPVPSASGAGAMPGSDEPQFTADGRPIRKVPFPTEEPTASGARPVLGQVPGPALSAKARRWTVVVVPVAVLIVLVIVFVAWRLLGRRPDPAAAERRPEGHSSLWREEQVAPAGARLASAAQAPAPRAPTQRA